MIIRQYSDVFSVKAFAIPIPRAAQSHWIIEFLLKSLFLEYSSLDKVTLSKDNLSPLRLIAHSTAKSDPYFEIIGKIPTALGFNSYPENTTQQLYLGQCQNIIVVLDKDMVVSVLLGEKIPDWGFPCHWVGCHI